MARSWDSPASKGMSIGPDGGVPGGDMAHHPGSGPGPASKRKLGMAKDMVPPDTASSARPKGMSTLRSGDS